jgi:hypothetical protein
MQYNQCGCEISSCEDPLLTTVDEQVDTPGLAGAKTRMYPLVLCPACAARRSAVERFFLWAFLLMIGGIVVAALLVQM